jgi:hypothetical protein
MGVYFGCTRGVLGLYCGCVWGVLRMYRGMEVLTRARAARRSLPCADCPTWNGLTALGRAVHVALSKPG